MDADLQAALERLYRRRRFGIRPGLDVEQEVLRRMGNPERSYGVIHVAGTNGKGSVCALLDSILRAAGYRVGLYTSPHLVRFNERIRVDGTCIEDRALGAVIADVEQVCDQVHREMDWETTFFESATAMGFEHFRREKVDVAVVEVGMGGRLDATNVVGPLVSVITRVSLEHTAYLGPDVRAIAGEKCGIIKAGRPVVAGATHPDALEVIRRTAKERGSRLIVADEEVNVALKSQDLQFQRVKVETSGTPYGLLKLALAGTHQVENLATAVAAVEVLREEAGLTIEDRHVAQGVASVQWAGRFQILKNEPPVVLDGGHNPGAAEALAQSVRRLFKGCPVALVTGMCRDKDGQGFFRAFSGLAKKVWAVRLMTEPERSVEPAEICAICMGFGCQAVESELGHALAAAEDWARSNGGVVVVTGSLFLVGEVLALLEEPGGQRMP